MPRFPRFRFLALTAMLSATPLAVSAQSWGDLFDLDRLAQIGARYALLSARSFVDLTYQDISISPLAGRMVLTGLEVSPRDGAGPRCVIQADRAVLASAPFDEVNLLRLRLEAVGLSVDRACLDREGQQGLTALGLGAITLDRALVDVTYTLSSGAADVAFQAVSDDLLEIDGTIEFSYFAMDASDMDADPVPVAHFAGARIDATDRGLWKRLDPFLPPEFANRDVVEQALLQELPNMFAEFNGGASASPAQTVFGNELAAIVADFTADPGRLVLELRPAAPVVLSEDLVEAPQRLFEALAPSVGTAPQDQPEEITGDDLARIEGALEADDLAADERLRFAAAFLGGRGIPRNPVMAVDLLLPLIEVGDSEALALSLGLLDRMEPHLAYWIALHAAAEGHSAALATLDRLEREMPLLDVIELQAERAEADGLMEPGSRGALREAAFAALTGLGQPRSYREAYALALISVAGGDSGAEAVLDEIDTRARRAGEDDRAIWASLIEEATDMATAAWLTGAGR